MPNPMRSFVCVCSIVLLAVAPPGAAPPPTSKVPVPDPRFGAGFIDSYAWLEADDDPNVIAWASAQTAYANAFVRAQPGYAALRARVERLSRTSTVRFGLQIRGTRWIYERTTPPQAQPVLVERDGPHGDERVLYDPLVAARGATPDAIDSIFPSSDGSRVAFTTQSGGSEDETLHVVEVAGGTLSSETIEHVGGGVSSVALAWDAGSGGFTYTHLPRTGPLAERRFDNRLFHHVVGSDPARDPYVFGRDQSHVAEYVVLSSPDATRTVALVEPGDLGDYAVYVRDANGPFRRVATVDDHVREAAFLGNTLLLKTSKRRGTFDVLALQSDDTFATAKRFVAAGTLPIEAMAVVAGSLYLTFSDGGESIVRRYDGLGAFVATLDLPPHVDVATVAGDPLAGPAIVAYGGYDTPSRWLSYDARSRSLAPTGIETEPAGDYSQLIVTRTFVTSKDGLAKIPLTTVRLPNTKSDGTAPTLLTAYGGYGIVESPSFVGSRLAWLERGGVLAYASVRGGGDYGEAWHLAAVRATKTKSSDDLASCARWLGTHGYGDARHLGIFGGSDGGFLMGLAITRDPERYRAVVGFVGIYDIPAWQRSPNGKSNIPEFGDANVPADLAYIRTQSPYQNVRDGVPYPAMLMITGENDPRVSPLNSRKMAARVQAASSSGNPVLLVQNGGAGHGIGSSFDERVTQTTQFLTFFASQLAP